MMMVKNLDSGSKDFKHLENLVLNIRGREWQKLRKKRRAEIVELCLRYWRARGFPYPDLTEDEIKVDYARLAQTFKEKIFIGDEIQMSMVGIKLANSFHPQMWKVKVNKSYTPLDRFNDDAQLRVLIQKALSIWGDYYSVNARNLRSMLRIYSTRRVSNFRPTAAKAIYEEYSGPGDTVLDFSAGYGGRLLGCLPLERRYIGVDPCAAQAGGLRRMIAKLKRLVKPNAQASIYRECAEDFMPTLESESVSLVFSSPPYFNNELYSRERSQSYIRYPDYGMWREEFLGRIIRESHRVLEADGHLVVNVADANGFKLTDDVLRLAAKYFKLTRTLRLRMSHRPYLRNRNGGAYRYEPVFVFRKLRRK